jgi:hypothetical protein
MINAVEGYIKLRRRAGFKMASAECLLQSFACFAAKRRETLIRMQTAIDWAALGPSVSQRDARLKEVCRFARHIRAEDHRHELPPANYFGYRQKRPKPHIYSLSEINSLIEAALRLRPKRGTGVTTSNLRHSVGAAGIDRPARIRSAWTASYRCHS